MNEINKTAFFNMLDALTEVYQRELSQMTKDIYYHALKPYHINEIKKSVVACVTGCVWYPRPAEIIEKIKNNRRLLETAASILKHDGRDAYSNYLYEHNIHESELAWITKNLIN